jgi:glycine/D-amino acid oxidase-like deaminating enzyme
MLEYSKLSFWEKELFFNDLDVTLIGSGLVGYSTAISIKEKYPTKKVVILERGYLPTGASTKNAGFTCFGSPTELLDDLNSMSENSVVELVKKRYDGLNILKQRCGSDSIDYIPCGSNELFTNSEKDLENYETSLSKINYLNELVENATTINKNFSIAKNTFGFSNMHGLIFSKGEGQINTGKMMNQLHKKAVDLGVHILFSTTVNTWKDEGESVSVETNYGSFKTKKLIIATNGLTKQIIPEINLSPARAQVIITKPLKNKPFEGTFHYDEGYYYFRNVENRILVGGGRNLDLKGEETDEIENTKIIMDSIKTLLHEVILPNQDVEIEYQWAGIMGVGETKEPIVKSISKNVYVGVRLGGMGVALGSLVGKELSEMISFE